MSERKKEIDISEPPPSLHGNIYLEVLQIKYMNTGQMQH